MPRAEPIAQEGEADGETKGEEDESKETLGGKIKAIFQGKSEEDATTSSILEDGSEANPATTTTTESSTPLDQIVIPVVEVKGPADIKQAAKRTLYTANVGDARAVLSYVLYHLLPSVLFLTRLSPQSRWTSHPVDVRSQGIRPTRSQANH